MGARSVTMGTGAAEIDLGKLRACLRTLRDEEVFLMLDDAIEQLSPENLEKVVRQYLDPERLRLDGVTIGPARLAASVRAFADATRAGDFYESFDVNSKNYTKLSRGTLAWISTFRRLIDRCVAAVEKEPASEVLDSMGVLLGLLELIDDSGQEVLFFADEGGSWLVGVDWGQVLPVWIRVLSASTDAKGFVIAVVERHRRLPPQAHAGFLELAEALAKPQQAAALVERISVETRDSRGER